MFINYYQTLEVSQEATQAEIKQAYRRLVKRFHPDTQLETANREKIVSINAAYETLKDPRSRRSYDQQLLVGRTYGSSTRRQQRTASAQNSYRRCRQTKREADIHQLLWLREVYKPISQLVNSILDPLDTQIDDLSADPFDDKLMEAFGEYIEDCRRFLDRARLVLASQPNPTKFAAVAAHIYYCLNQIGDGIDELEWFTLNYDDRHLHTGKELFRIAQRLHCEAQDTANALA